MPETVVNTGPAGQFPEPTVTKLASGGWVVVWHTGQDNLDIAAQIYDAQGVRVGGQLSVNTTTAGWQGGANVAGLPDGGFIVNWIDQSTGYVVRTQRFDAAGTKVGGEVTVSTGGGVARSESKVSVADDGSYIVSWQSSQVVNGAFQDTNWVARYDAAGNKIGNDLTFAALNNYNADWVALSASRLAVIYGGSEVRAAFVDIGTGPITLGTPIVLSGEDWGGGNTDLSLVKLANGNLVAAWIPFYSIYSYGVRTRMFGADGAIGSVSIATNDIVGFNDIRLSALADGGYAIGWSWGIDGQPISLARIFDATGDAIGGAMQVNLAAIPPNTPRAPSIIGLDGGQMVAVYRGADVLMQTLELPTRQSGTADADTVNGTARPDEIHGLNGADTIDGLGGADEIYGGGGQDLLTGGAGDDVIAGEADADQILGGDGNDRLHTANMAAEAPYSYDFEGGLDRGTEIDSLSGGAGNDMLFAGLGDTVDGGPDTDALYLSVAAAASGVTIDFSLPGAAMVIAGGSITNVEHLAWFEGSNFADTVIAGPQSEIPGFYSIRQGTVHGGGGNDHLTAGYYTTNLFGEAGDDILIGVNRNGQNLIGGAGADTITGGTESEFLSSGDATTTPWWSNNALTRGDAFDRGAEIDTITAGGGSDQVNIGYGDSADGGTGSDQLVISFAGAPSGVTANFNATTLSIGGGTITGFEEIAFVEGSDFDDSITLTSTYSGTQNVLVRGGNDTIVTGISTQYIDGGSGDDDIDARLSTNIQYIAGGTGNDMIRISNRASEVRGGEGNDTIYGYQNVHGDAGNDLIVLANTSVNTIMSSGGAGNDEMRASNSGSWFSGGEGSDLLIGGNGNDRLFSGNHAGTGTNVADMGTEHDVIQAGGGDDNVAIGYGDDADGGTGTDTLTIVLALATSGVTMSTAALIGGVPVTVGGGTIQGFERVSGITGTAYDDVITATTQAVAITVLGGDGNDRLIATGSAATLSGGYGDDWLVSGQAVDTLLGGFGTDTADFSALATGITLTLATPQGEIATASNGDRLNSIENVVGTAQNDTLTGNADANRLEGGAGDDILNGGLGADTLVGGTGRDIYYVDNAGDVIVEGEETGVVDSVMASVSYVLTVGAQVERLAAAPTAGNINLTGNEYRDRIQGNDGDNILSGGLGDDAIKASAGNDTLLGGYGNDKLTGGTGADRFVFARYGDNDMVTDFELGIDKIDLSAFNLTWSQVQAMMSETAGSTRINLGDGDSVTLRGVTNASLSVGDFILTAGTSAIEPLLHDGALWGDVEPAVIGHGAHQLQPMLQPDLWSGADWHAI